MKMMTLVFAVIIGIGMCVPNGLAGTINRIEISGIDIAYNGTNITDFDLDGNDPDPLVTASFFSDMDLVGPVLTADLFLDLDIPNVTDIPVAGGIVTSDTGGTMDLTFNGDHLSLNLGTVAVAFSNIPGIIQFVHANTVATVASQALPYGITMEDPVTVSFSTQVNAMTDDGELIPNVTSFTASGTGEARSTIPEPGSIAILMLGIMGCSAGYLRRHWG